MKRVLLAFYLISTIALARGLFFVKGGSAPFNPSQVSGLTLWLDATNSAKINSGSPSDGNAVTAWNDASTNGFNLTVPGATPPIYKTSIINSKPIIRFNGSASTWIASTGNISSIVTSTAFTSWVVLNSPSVALDNGCNTANAFISDSVWRDGQAFIGIYLRSTGPNVVFETYPTPECSPFSLSTTFMAQARLDSGNEVLRINQNSEVSTAAGPIGNLNNPFFVGAGDSGGDQPVTADIAEILFYNVVVSSTDRGKIETYLKSKWGF